MTRAARTLGPSGTRSWTVVNQVGIPIEAADQYLRWLWLTDKSANTVQAYARHISLFFRWLDAYCLVWEEVTLDQLVSFMGDLACGRPPVPKRGGGERDKDTMRAIASAMREFFEFHQLEGRGPTGLVLTRTAVHSAKTKYSFLAHVEKRNPVAQNKLAGRGKGSSAKARAGRIELINFEEDFLKLVDAAGSARDRLLLSSFYDVGLRVGQALGLRHEDLDPMRKRVRVKRREDNVNAALSKQRETFWVTAPPRFFDFYRDYLIGEFVPSGVDSDYLFINLGRAPIGQPCSYSNVKQMVERVGGTIGWERFRPHAMRHTHATALAKAGWTTAEIAARLGQSFASSADVYIHLANSDLETKLEATQHLIWPETPVRETNA